MLWFMFLLFGPFAVSWRSISEKPSWWLDARMDKQKQKGAGIKKTSGSDVFSVNHKTEYNNSITQTAMRLNALH